MSRRIRSLVVAWGAAALAVGVLSGCASGQGGASSAPPATQTGDTVDVGAAWLDGGAMVGVLVAGSSTCKPFAEEVAYDDGVLTVSVMEPDGACTRDYVLRGLAVPLPEGVDPAEDLTIEVRGSGYVGRTDLPGAPGLTPGTGLDGGQPSAGWAGPGTFALLTWGSSSCPPQVESAAVSAPGEISVAFVAPAPDQICTADMAARVTVVEVPDVPAGLAYEAALSGDSYDGIRIPIAGQP
ncbi:hypothetical protein F6B41_01805 [Microbacterium lushaniae]|nr:hypothetical protein F6B41_26470 [Microbacterium lushaniae]KAA9159208.1 hypothetical protein F6B41_01805 [Microbacterium lushaniae]